MRISIRPAATASPCTCRRPGGAYQVHAQQVGDDVLVTIAFSNGSDPLNVAVLDDIRVSDLGDAWYI